MHRECDRGGGGGRRRREEEEGGGDVCTESVTEEEELYLFLHCWKGGGCLQLDRFGSCERGYKQYTKLYHTVVYSPHIQSLADHSPAGVAALPLVTGVALSFRAFPSSSDDSLLLSLELSSSACTAFTLSFTFSDPPVFPLVPVVCGKLLASSELEDSELELELLSA